MKRIILLILVAIIIILLIIIFWTQTAAAKDDFQYWSQYSFKTYDSEKIDLVTFADARFKEDASKVGLYYISERLILDFWEHLSLGANYTYLNSRKTDPAATKKDYRWQHRLELEGNPHWQVDQFKVHMRNRMEFRWIENNGSYNTRYRQRWTLTYPLKENDYIKSIYMNGEFFYNIAEHEYNENRMIPFGISLKLNEKTGVNVYYMVQSQKGSNDWSSNQILGTLLSMKF